MNPNSSGEGGPQHSFELPPQKETAENRPQAGEIQNDKALERAASDDSRAGRQQPVLAPATQVAVPSDQTQVGDDDAAAPPPHQISDDDAKEGDVIEKVWIHRAKAIIAQSQNDPFSQKNEMSRVKADYIQKRFNKTIPVDDKKA